MSIKEDNNINIRIYIYKEYKKKEETKQTYFFDKHCYKRWNKNFERVQFL